MQGVEGGKDPTYGLDLGADERQAELPGWCSR